LPKPKTTRANPAPARGVIRQLHIWTSVFVAPSLLFFAFTGGLQTFRIPDQKAAPVLIQKLARVHKDNVFALKPTRPKKPEADGRANAGKPPEPKPQSKPSTEVLKYFFAFASWAIGITTLLGLWMALAYSRDKLVVWILLIAGAATPVLILLLV
jgi:hypothetical protein